jgi:hypothetical protein
MDMKRRLARAASVLAVAILLGHFVQTMSQHKAAEATSSAPAADPKVIVPVAAGPAASAAPAILTPLPSPVARVAPAADTAAIVAAPVVTVASADPTPDALPKPMMADMTGAGILRPIFPSTAPTTIIPTAADPEPAVVDLAPAIVSTTEPEPSIVPKAMEVLLQPETGCQKEMDLAVVADAVIEITLLSPCHPNERLVLRHGPLAITAQTTAQGSAFLKIPALDSDAAVSMRFADGSTIDGSIQVPDLAKLRRFAVQWMDRDTFGVNAFENGSGYGGTGHISASNPGKLPLTGTVDGGYLMILGDTEAAPAMLAEVYTYPMDSIKPVEVSIEAEVTADTCGRELLGEVITSGAGTSDVSDLTLAMPDCSALGDILVLKNPVQNLTLAAAN